MIEQKPAGSLQEFQKRRPARLLRRVRGGPRAGWQVALLAPSLIGIAGLSTVNYEAGVVLAMLIALLEVVGKLFLQKRRDDLLAETARYGECKIDLIHAISVYEAVRSRQLTSDGIVRLLRNPEPEHRDPGETPTR
jgi:hypothetical protein